MELTRYDQKIDESEVVGLLRQLRRGETPKRVVIDSPGGHFYFFEKLAPAIRSQQIVTIASTVHSAALLLFVLGHTRLALPNATFYFHEVSGPIVDGGHTFSISELTTRLQIERLTRGKNQLIYERRLRQWRRDQTWAVDFVSREIGVARETLLTLMKNEVTLTAKEAVHYGFAERIVNVETLISL